MMPPPTRPARPSFTFEDMVAHVTEYAIFTLDLDGHVQNWNRGAQMVKQYAPEEIIGSHFSRFYSEEARAAGIPAWELEVVKEKGCFTDEGWRFRRDGSQFWASVTIHAILDPQTSEVSGFLKITRDLTERMMATEALRQSEERFRLLLESVKDYAIFMLDPEGHVMSWNAGARRLKGYEEAEILGSHFSRFYPEEARASHVPESLLRQALTEGRAETEGWRVRKDGGRFWGNVVITPLHDAAGELRGFAKVTRDMTSARTMARLEETARLKDVFLATLGHELRNPIAPLLPGVEILRRSSGNPAVVESIAGVFERQIGQMARLIDDLLDMSRINSGKINLKKELTSLREMVDSAVEAVNPLISQQGHDFQVSLPAGPPLRLLADPQRLSQVVTNLLTNAARYTPPGGRISLVATVEHGAVLQLAVTDNGCGIPEDVLPRVFELFEQGATEPGQGLGIGLTLVKNLVELHGGTVSLHSAGEGLGCTAIVRLPVLASGAEEAVEAVDAAVSAPRALRVLVADDARSSADVMGMFFQMEGMEVAVAYDGEEAVEKARSFRPDLVFLDLGMPRLDGYEAARRIIQLLPRATVIALSGWGREDDKRRSAEAGFRQHLVKPVKPADLREVLESLR